MYASTKIWFASARVLAVRLDDSLLNGPIAWSAEDLNLAGSGSDNHKAR
jgi:hypothetical protein